VSIGVIGSLCVHYDKRGLYCLTKLNILPVGVLYNSIIGKNGFVFIIIKPMT